MCYSKGSRITKFKYRFLALKDKEHLRKLSYLKKFCYTLKFLQFINVMILVLGKQPYLRSN